MSKVRIVTDSTADIPADLRASLGISLVPLNVIFGEESFEDGVTMTPDQFYARLTTAASLPKTSQPSPAVFQQVYERLLAEGDGPIISIHLSSQMSGTYQAAKIASDALEGAGDITVVDSRSASFGHGMLAAAAAAAAQKGADKEAILTRIVELRAAQRLYFLVDTLEYLQKGGRIGKAAALFGSLLNIKPILSVNSEGVVYSVDKVRGQKKAMNRILELLQADMTERRIHLTLAYSTDRQLAEELERLIRQHFEAVSVHYTHLGPVIGAHVGPGTVAAFAVPA